MVKDLTSGTPMRVLLAFSVPMLIGNLVQQLYNMVDLIVVGRFVGVHALAAVGAAGSTMFFVFSLVAGLTNGASVVVSQYYGHGDTEKTQQTIATAVWVLGAAALLLTVLGVLVVPPLLRLMNTPAEIIGEASTYLQVIFLGIVVTVAYNASASILRALGDSVTPLVFLIVAVVLNIFLDLLFVIQFNMGVAGVAWATVAAQAIAAFGCIFYAVYKLPILRLQRRHFRADKVILRQTLKLGIPGGIQNSLVSIGAMTVQSVVNSFGPQVVAAYSAALKLDQLAVQPLLSLSMATATFTAQNIGAGKMNRVRKGFHSAVGLAAIFCAVITPLLFFFGHRLMALFVAQDADAVLQIGAEYLRIVPLFYIVLGVIILLENFLRGAGDVLVPMISNALEIVVRIAVAYLFAHFFGYVGIWWSGPISWAVGTVVCALRYFSGKWQTKTLVFNPSDS